METRSIAGLRITHPYEATSPGVARIQCEECGAWERQDTKSKGCMVAGQLRHSKRCDSRPQLPEVASVLAASEAKVAGDAKSRRINKLAAQLRRTGSAVGFSDEEVFEARRLGLISESTAMNRDD